MYVLNCHFKNEGSNFFNRKQLSLMNGSNKLLLYSNKIGHRVSYPTVDGKAISINKKKEIFYVFCLRKILFEIIFYFKRAIAILFKHKIKNSQYYYGIKYKITRTNYWIWLKILLKCCVLLMALVNCDEKYTFNILFIFSKEDYYIWNY